VSLDVAALLVREPDNQYDPNAIAVWVGGVKVGHLSRGAAARMLAGLIALERSEGRRIALPGTVVGGGMRGDGIGLLGVFLRYDPEDFGLPAARRPRDQDDGEPAFGKELHRREAEDPVPYPA